MVKKGILLFVLSLVIFIALVSVSACKNASYSSEGSPGSPVLLVVGSPHQGTIAEESDSYYRFVAAANGAHTIALTNTQSDLGWYLFDPSYNWMATCDDYYGAADEIDVTPALTSGLTYYLRVHEWDEVDGTFTVTVTYP